MRMTYTEAMMMLPALCTGVDISDQLTHIFN